MIKIKVTGGYSAARTGEIVDRQGGSFAGVAWAWRLVLTSDPLPAANAAGWNNPDSVDLATPGIARVNFVIPSNTAVGRYRLAIRMTTGAWTELVVAEDDFIEVS